MVSIIVPVYNAEVHLRECIDSIISQSDPDWELILVDDGSTDNSAFIIDKYAGVHPRIRAIHTANHGQSAARNRGLEAAYGEHIMFADADDTLHPRMLEIMTRESRGRPFHIVQCGWCEGRLPRYVLHSHPRRREYDAPSATVDMLYQRRVHHSPCAALYPRGVFAAERFTEGILYEDLELLPRVIAASAGVVSLVHKLYFYRQTPGSSLHTWSRRRTDVLDVTESIERRMAATQPGAVRAARSRRMSANFNMFVLAVRHGDTATADRCWEYIRTHRGSTLADTRVRLKNKLGALLGLAGRRAVEKVARLTK